MIDHHQSKMDVVFSSKIEDTHNKMSTVSERINNEIEALHAQNVKLAQERKYTEIHLNLEKIKILELEKSQVNKVNELTELMTFLKKEIVVKDPHHIPWEQMEHRSFNGQSNEISSLISIERKLFRAMFEAITELNRKVDELTPKVSSTDIPKCKCCSGFGIGLIQENGYCRHCQSST